MKRREFFAKAGLGSAAFASLPALGGGRLATATRTRQDHDHAPVTGPLATATVSFGQWPTGIDRFPDLGAPQLPNGHQLIPHEAKVQMGGTVNFVIAGFHHVLVYAPGTRPEDINTALTVPNHGGPPLIDDPSNRVYRGLDPLLVPQDRVEVVRFAEPGQYLVICGVFPHFVLDGMFGYVKVVPPA